MQIPFVAAVSSTVSLVEWLRYFLWNLYLPWKHENTFVEFKLCIDLIILWKVAVYWLGSRQGKEDYGVFGYFKMYLSRKFGENRCLRCGVNIDLLPQSWNLTRTTSISLLWTNRLDRTFVSIESALNPLNDSSFSTTRRESSAARNESPSRTDFREIWYNEKTLTNIFVRLFECSSTQLRKGLKAVLFLFDPSFIWGK